MMSIDQALDDSIAIVVQANDEAFRASVGWVTSRWASRSVSQYTTSFARVPIGIRERLSGSRPLRGDSSKPGAGSTERAAGLCAHPLRRCHRHWNAVRIDATIDWISRPRVASKCSATSTLIRPTFRPAMSHTSARECWPDSMSRSAVLCWPAVIRRRNDIHTRFISSRKGRIVG